MKYLVEKNEELKENLEKSVERIFLLKKWIHKSNYKITHHSQIYKFLEKPNHIHISNSIADKAVTCIHKSSKFPPDLRYIKKCFHFIHTDFELKKRPLENFQKKIVGFFDEAETTVNKTIQENKSFSIFI
jgi:hypothetical protein